MRSCGSLGVSAYLVPAFLFAYALFLGFGKEALHPHLKKVGGLVLIVSSAVLFGLQGDTVRLHNEELPSGAARQSRFPLSPPGRVRHRLVHHHGDGHRELLMLLTPFSLRGALAWMTQRLRQAHGADRDHGCPLPGQGGKGARGEAAPVQPKEPPKIVDTQREAARMREQKEKREKPAKPVQSSFGFMEGKGEYKLPAPDLLDPIPPAVKRVTKEDMLAQSALLSRKFMDFDIQGRVVQVYPGPVVTMFEFEPAPGVKVSKIVNLSDDLALAMKAGSVRIVAPLPGKAAVGIEVPNNTRETVYFREILESPLFQSNKSRLKIPLGKDIFGVPVVTTIEKMPHLLVAGATGSGKSVAINAVILALLYNARPNEVKLVLVDPKMLELSLYNDIPHLLSPVVTQPKRAAETLRALVAEMERRYRQLAGRGSKNIESYNKIVPEVERLPYIVVIIDELADLMMTVQREVEDSIMRLAQMARAAGIHLIVATQRRAWT